MESVKKRIKQARRDAKLSQESIAEAMGLSRQMIGLWENLDKKDVPSIEQMRKIAGITGRSAAWLMLGISESFSDGPRIRSDVPLISWVQAGAPKMPLDLFEPNDAIQRLACPAPHGEHTFALRVEGNSMINDNPLGKSYPHDSIIFCDPDQRGGVASGTPVIAAMLDSGEATFKIYIRDAGRQWLAPLNTEYDRIYEPFEIRALVLGLFIPS